MPERENDAKNARRGPVLVLVDRHPHSIYLMRSAMRKAQLLGAEWEAIPLPAKSLVEDEQPLLELPLVVRRKGGILTLIDEHRFFKNLTALIETRAREGTPPQAIVLAKDSGHTWRSLFGFDIEARLRRKFGRRMEITPIPLEEEVYFSPESWTSFFEFRLVDLFYTLLTLFAATCLIEMIYFIEPTVISPHNRNKVVIYFMAIAFVAGRYGLLPGLVAAFLSFFTLRFLYTPLPLYPGFISLTDGVNLGLYLFAAAFISIFLSQSRAQREVFVARAKRVQALFHLHWVTLVKRSRIGVVEALHRELARLFEAPVAFFLTTVKKPTELSEIFPLDTRLSADAIAALTECWKDAKITGWGTAYYSQSDWRFEPLMVDSGVLGVLGVELTPTLRHDRRFGRLMNAVANQAAHILERTEIGSMMEESRVREEREKLRSLLLSSVSHDLKTPLASIIGSLSVFRSMKQHLPEEHRTLLIDTAIEEAQRLDSFITNILDMTRIESGDLKFKSEWITPDQLLKDAQKRLRVRLAKHNFVTRPAERDIELLLDIMMTEQVLQNILDNAAKYTPAGTTIELWGGFEDEDYKVYVRDHGAGIPDGAVDRVFDKYARLHRADMQVAGTGLGLAICKSVMTAQGGNITAGNHPDGGAIFTLTLPKWRKIAVPPVEEVA